MGDFLNDNAAELRERYRYEPETGLFFGHGGRQVGSTVGAYRKFSIRLAGQKAHSVSMHRLAFTLMNEPVPEWVDHINQDGLDNRWCNLRPCSRWFNLLNRGVSSWSHIRRKPYVVEPFRLPHEPPGRSSPTADPMLRINGWCLRHADHDILLKLATRMVLRLASLRGDAIGMELLRDAFYAPPDLTAYGKFRTALALPAVPDDRETLWRYYGSEDMMLPVYQFVTDTDGCLETYVERRDEFWNEFERLTSDDIRLCLNCLS